MVVNQPEMLASASSLVLALVLVGGEIWLWRCWITLAAFWTSTP